jgi:hypothetical protein
VNAFAGWLDNDAVFIGFLLTLLATGFGLAAIGSRLRSRGEEAGVPEERDEEMAVAHAARVEPSAADWDLWEEQFYSLTPLVDRVARIKEGRR